MHLALIKKFCFQAMYYFKNSAEDKNTMFFKFSQSILFDWEKW